MSFRNNAYATIWKIDSQDNHVKVLLSTSRKTQEGVYETDFSQYCYFYGKARDKASTLVQNDRIKLTNVEASTVYNKELNKTYYFFKVWDFEPAGSSDKPTNQDTDGVNPVEGDTSVIEDDTPF